MMFKMQSNERQYPVRSKCFTAFYLVPILAMLLRLVILSAWNHFERHISGIYTNADDLTTHDLAKSFQALFHTMKHMILSGPECTHRRHWNKTKSLTGTVRSIETNACSKYTPRSFIPIATWRNDFWQFDFSENYSAIRMRNKLISIDSGTKSTTSTGLHFCPIRCFHIFSQSHVQLLRRNRSFLHRKILFSNHMNVRAFSALVACSITCNMFRTISLHSESASSKRKKLSMKLTGKLFIFFSTERCKPKIPQKCFIFFMLSQFSFPLVHNIDLFVFIIRCIDWYRYALASGSLTDKFAMSRIVSVFTVVKIRILILVEQYFISSVLAFAAVKIHVNAHENEKKMSLFSLWWQAVVLSSSFHLDECDFFFHRRNNIQLCYSFEKAVTDLPHETGSEYGRQRITMKYFVFERKLALPFYFLFTFNGIVISFPRDDSFVSVLVALLSRHCIQIIFVCAFAERNDVSMFRGEMPLEPWLASDRPTNNARIPFCDSAELWNEKKTTTNPNAIRCKYMLARPQVSALRMAIAVNASAENVNEHCIGWPNLCSNHRNARSISFSELDHWKSHQNL